MKKAILLFSACMLFFTNCTEENDQIDNLGPNATIVGFTENFTSNFGTNLDDSTLIVPVDLISYSNETLPGEVTVEFSVDAASTAVAGVDYEMPSNMGVRIPAGSTVVTIPIVVHPITFDPATPKVLILNLDSASNAVIGMQYQQVIITLQGVCVSELTGLYTTVTTRLENGTQYTFDNEHIISTVGTSYETEYIGGYHGTTSPAGIFLTTAGVTGSTTVLAEAPKALLTFTEVCGKLKVETQNLANAYLNEVLQSPQQYDISTVSEDGVITIAYTITFSAGNRDYISVFTPQ